MSNNLEQRSVDIIRRRTDCGWLCGAVPVISFLPWTKNVGKVVEWMLRIMSFPHFLQRRYAQVEFRSLDLYTMYRYIGSVCEEYVDCGSC